MSLISLVQVSKSFGSAAAVTQISFDVEEGENFVLLGTSGCGKTTTLKMINKLIPVSQGTISVNGKNISDQSPELLRRGIGYVLQHNSLFPHYTIAENIAVVPKLLQWTRVKTEARTAELLEQMHLPSGYLSRYPRQLSGGEAQRINLARALAADPPILLMDEPFGALDPITRLSIRKEFSELEALKRKTILMVTHDVMEAFELGNRICLMDKGRIVQTGTPAELLFQPVNDFVKNFLSGSYMQLAFMSASINDLWPYLEQEGNVPLSESAVTGKTSLWTVMEQMTTGNLTQINLQSEATKEIRRTSVAGLMQAFTAYKKQF